MQEEIIKRSTDESLLVWEDHNAKADDRLKSGTGVLLARYPAEFKGSGDCRVPWYYDHFYSDLEVTKAGIRLSCVVLPLHNDRYAAVLNCRYGDGSEDTRRYCGLKIRYNSGENPQSFNDEQIGYWIDDIWCDKCSSRGVRLSSGIRSNRLLSINAEELAETQKTNIAIKNRQQSKRPVRSNRSNVDTIWIRLCPDTDADIVHVQPSGLWSFAADMRSGAMSLGKGFALPVRRLVKHPDMKLGRTFVRTTLVLRHQSGQSIRLKIDIIKHMERVYTSCAGFVGAEILESTNFHPLDFDWSAQRQRTCILGDDEIEVQDSIVPSHRAREYVVQLSR